MIELAVEVHESPQGVRVVAQDGTGRRVVVTGSTIKSALGKLGAYISLGGMAEAEEVK